MLYWWNSYETMGKFSMHNNFVTLRWIFILKTFGQHLRPQFRTVSCQSQGILILFKLAGPITHGQENLVLMLFRLKKNHLNLWTKTHDELRKYLRISMSWSWRLKLLRLDILVVLALAKKRGPGLKKMTSFIAFTIFSVVMKQKIFYATWPREGGTRANSKKNTCDSTWFCFFDFSFFSTWKVFFRLPP